MTEAQMPVARIGDPPAAAERVRVIADAAPLARQFVPLAGGYREVPVIEVPEGELLYRAANGRVVAELSDHARRVGGSLSEIVADETGVATQRLLHGLLVAKAADADGPVMQELARHGQQTEPLLVTAEGVVVNGNRRLAAMRELRARDPERYAGFARVTAGILPADLGMSDIEFIEAALQMAPEVKLAYGWINRRLKLRRQRRDLGLSDAAIAEAYRMDTPEQVGREVGELELAEAYLAAFKGSPDYPAVADAEPLFVGLAAQLALLPDEARPFWQAAGFAMIDARGAIASPIDRFFPFAAPVPATMPAWAMRRLGEEAGLLPIEDDQHASSRAAPPPAGTIPALTGHFADPALAPAHAKMLAGLLEQLRAEHEQNRAPLTALKLVMRARTALASVEVGRMTRKQLHQLRSEMAALEASVAALLGEAPQMPETQPGLIKRLMTGR